jgi:protein-disulfide isomerase
MTKPGNRTSPFGVVVLSAALALLAGAGSGEAQTIRGAEMGYVTGDPAAPVEVIEFSDFGCPACARFSRETQPAIFREFVDTGRVRWRMVPIQMGGFRNSLAATRAAECAGEQGRFWEIHGLLYGNQGEWQRERRPEAMLREHALAAGVEAPEWDRCIASGAVLQRTRTQTASARALGIRGTPSFFINGARVHGALPAVQFRQFLLRAEAEAGAGAVP